MIEIKDNADQLTKVLSAQSEESYANLTREIGRLLLRTSPGIKLTLSPENSGFFGICWERNNTVFMVGGLVKDSKDQWSVNT